MNGTDPWLTIDDKMTVQFYSKIFGDEFLSHLMIVFTRWGYDKRAFIEREYNHKDEATVKSRVLNDLKKYLQKEHIPQIKFAFIDNLYSNPEIAKDSAKLELDQNNQQVESIRNFVAN